MLRAKSDVVVRLDEAERGSIPARCARTGERCISRVRLRTSAVHPVLEWATWTGLWPFRRPDEGHPVVLSLLPRVWRRHRALQLARDVTAVLVPTILLASLFTGGTVRDRLLALLLVLIGLKAVVALAGALLTVRVLPAPAEGWVRLAGLHPKTSALIETRTTRPTSAPPPDNDPSRATAQTADEGLAAAGSAAENLAVTGPASAGGRPAPGGHVVSPAGNGTMPASNRVAPAAEGAQEPGADASPAGNGAVPTGDHVTPADGGVIEPGTDASQAGNGVGVADGGDSRTSAARGRHADPAAGMRRTRKRPRGGRGKHEEAVSRHEAASPGGSGAETAPDPE